MIRSPRRAFRPLVSAAVVVAGVFSALSASSVAGANAPAWHTAASPTPLGSWFAVAYNNKTWVAAGRTGDIAYSSDAVTWHTVAVPVGSWQSLAYGKGIWVSLSSNNSVPGELTSVSGKLWTSHSAPAGDWSSLAFGNGLFVASSFDGSIMTSKDGLHWTMRVTGTGHESFYAIAYGNGRFVTVDDNQGDFAMSTDGVHWSISHSPSTSDGWGSVAFGNGTFVAFDGNGTGLMATSVNGTVWAYHSYPHAGSNWSGTFGCNQFFSVSSYNVVGNANYEFSSLGATWSATPTALDVSGVNWAAVGYGNGKFVAVNDAGHITWKAASGPCKQNVPDPVTNVRGTVAANKLTVNWNAPTYGGVKKTSSYVVKVTSDGFLKRCYSTSTTCSISGLKAKATYAVVVTAVNEAGYFSVPSDAVSVLAPATSNFAITPTSPVRLVGQDVTAWISGAPTYTTVTAKIGATTTGCFTNGFGQCELSFVESLAGQHLIGATYVAAHVTHHATNAEFSSLSVTGIASSYATSASISATFTGGVPNAYGALSIEGVTTSSKLDASGNGVVNATAPASVGTGSTMINVYDDGQLLESVAINLTM